MKDRPIIQLSENQVAALYNEACVANGKTHWHRSTIEYDEFKIARYRSIWWIQRRDYGLLGSR